MRAILPHPLLRVAGDFLPRPLLRCREGVAEAGRARHFFDNAPATPVAEGVAESSARWAANKEILNGNFCTGPYVIMQENNSRRSVSFSLGRSWPPEA